MKCIATLMQERDRLARQVFLDLLEDGTMRFMVITDELSIEKAPDTKLPTSAPDAGARAARESGEWQARFR